MKFLICALLLAVALGTRLIERRSLEDCGRGCEWDEDNEMCECDDGHGPTRGKRRSLEDCEEGCEWDEENEMCECEDDGPNADTRGRGRRALGPHDRPRCRQYHGLPEKCDAQPLCEYRPHVEKCRKISP